MGACGFRPYTPPGLRTPGQPALMADDRHHRYALEDGPKSPLGRWRKTPAESPWRGIEEPGNSGGDPGNTYLYPKRLRRRER